MVVTFYQISRSSFLTPTKYFGLLRDFLEPAQYLSIPLREAVDHIRDLHLFTKLPDVFLRSPKVVTRYAWEEVMNGLELQTSVHKVEPGRAIDVHGCA